MKILWDRKWMRTTAIPLTNKTRFLIPINRVLINKTLNPMNSCKIIGFLPPLNNLVEDAQEPVQSATRVLFRAVPVDRGRFLSSFEKNGRSNRYRAPEQP
jgi:hypothetical protein